MRTVDQYSNRATGRCPSTSDRTASTHNGMGVCRRGHGGEIHLRYLGRTSNCEEIEGQIEAANTLELEAAPLGKMLSSGASGGELVNKEDLWSCLFRQKPAQNQAVSPTVEREMGRRLRAAAAEERQNR